MNPPPTPAPETGSASNIGLIGAIVGVVIALGGISYGGYYYYRKKNGGGSGSSDDSSSAYGGKKFQLDFDDEPFLSGGGNANEMHSFDSGSATSDHQNLLRF